MYLLTHSLSPVLVPVAVMNIKVLKTKISHTHSLILSLLPAPALIPTLQPSHRPGVSLHRCLSFAACLHMECLVCTLSQSMRAIFNKLNFDLLYHSMPRVPIVTFHTSMISIFG